MSSHYSKQFTWNKKEVAKGLREVEGVRHEVLRGFSDLLNGYHHTKESIIYWDTIAGDWLEHFIHLVYVATLQAKQSNTKERQCLIPVVSDLEEYSNLRTYSTDFHDQLAESVTELSKGCSVSGWLFSKDSVEAVTGKGKSIKDRALRKISTPTPFFLMVAPYFKCSRNEQLLTLAKWRKWAAFDNLNDSISWNATVDTQWRLSQAKKESTVGFKELILALLPLYIPVVLLEGFKSYFKSAMSLGVFRPTIVYSANALHDNLLFKLLVAEWRKKGTKLFYHQHGGGYGVDRIHVLEEYETRIADRYLTLGWEKEENPNVKPLCVPQLKRHKLTRRKLFLLMCVDYPHLPYRIHFQPMPGSIDKLYSETILFATELSKNKNFVVRPYKYDYTEKFIRNLEDCTPKIKLDIKGKGVSLRYSQSRLVMHNYLGTSYIETLSLNIPTVVFYDSNIYEFRSEVKPYIEQLKKVGILHESAIEAARFVNSLNDNPEAWWALPKVQTARKNFVDHYGGLSIDWRRAWEKEFKPIGDQKRQAEVSL